MKELALKYGCNPNQKPSRIYMDDGRELPIEVINGRPGYINFLDAFNSWQLVKELKAATGMPAAASFKHVSPAGAAIGLPLSDTLKKIYFCDDVDFELSPLACAYVRARGADRMCSYGDFVALSDVCDEATALLIKREVSDGVIAPGYTPEAIKVLKEKRKGTYCVIQIDPDYVPAPIEHKQVFGVTFEQGRNEVKLDDPALFEDIPTKNKNFTAEAKRDLIISLITLKYTQSNSVCYVKDGQAIGIGAGQHNACRKRINKEKLKRGFLVADIHGTFLSEQLFFLVHNPQSLIIILLSRQSGQYAHPHSRPPCLSIVPHAPQTCRRARQMRDIVQTAP